MGDFNDDNVVDAKDAAIMAAMRGDFTVAQNGSAAVPEPSAMILLSGLVLALLLWQRRK